MPNQLRIMTSGGVVPAEVVTVVDNRALVCLETHWLQVCAWEGMARVIGYVSLVDPTDPDATPCRIMTANDGVKAISSRPFLPGIIWVAQYNSNPWPAQDIVPWVDADWGYKKGLPTPFCFLLWLGYWSCRWRTTWGWVWATSATSTPCDPRAVYDIEEPGSPNPLGAAWAQVAYTPFW